MEKDAVFQAGLVERAANKREIRLGSLVGLASAVCSSYQPNNVAISFIKMNQNKKQCACVERRF
jgi:hypothetical protein